MRKKKQLDSNEIKSRVLNILLFFQKFCKDNHLCFYLSGGTLLGAIRHKGFIPWDDDVDVCMPRPDFEKLLRIYPKEKQQYMLGAFERENMAIPFAKLVDMDTDVETLYSLDEMNRKLWIDIIPVDGLPESIENVRKIYRNVKFYRTVLMLVDARLGEGQTVFRKYAKYILKPLANIYGKERCIQKIESISKSYSYKQSEYVGAISWGLYGKNERMLKSEFEKPVEVEFEGHKFPTFSCWDSYLHGLYGDYMQLPPVEKRHTHDMTVYLLD